MSATAERSVVPAGVQAWVHHRPCQVGGWVVPQLGIYSCAGLDLIMTGNGPSRAIDIL